MGKPLAPLLGIFFAFGIVGANAVAEIEVSDPWVRAGPPSAAVLAGYMALKNTGVEAVSIVEATSAQFARVEMHRTEIDDKGMARMFQVKAQKLEPGAQVEFKPGSDHFMLIKPKNRLKVGDHVMIELKLSDGSTTQVHATVRTDDEPAAAGDDHHHH